MLEKFQHKLSDMDFPINAKAESRVLVPWEHTKYPNSTKEEPARSIDEILDGPFSEEWQGDGSVWEAFRRTCDPKSPARRLFTSLRSGPNTLPKNRLDKSGDEWRFGLDFNFSGSADGDIDFCSDPSARYQHGHFFSDWKTIPALYPVFSPAKGQGYSDILIPSHHYYLPTRKYTYGYNPFNSLSIKAVDDDEVPWNQKTDKIFWRGLSTPGGSSPPGFVSHYQRHRFVAMASDASDHNRTISFLYPPGSSEHVLTNVPVSKLNHDIMDVAFTRAVGCIQYPGGCDGMKQALRFAAPVPLGHHWQHKYLMDIDGTGFSARFFAFLMSGSAVMKATAYREFYSDWIQPWLHYIPISSGYAEIYNIHAYFSGPSPAMLSVASKLNSTASNSIRIMNPAHKVSHIRDAELRMIAHAGRAWKRKLGRKEDLEAYLYRLCLEYARLWADDRASMSYRPVAHAHYDPFGTYSLDVLYQ
ncbi:capsule-associated protein CAP1 [Tulasnella sp. 418]|nr:capsule-associated protein CAP1 [Tulasnella sp. 418]